MHLALVCCNFINLFIKGIFPILVLISGPKRLSGALYRRWLRIEFMPKNSIINGCNEKILYKDMIYTIIVKQYIMQEPIIYVIYYESMTPCPISLCLTKVPHEVITFCCNYELNIVLLVLVLVLYHKWNMVMAVRILSNCLCINQGPSVLVTTPTLQFT